MRVLMVSHGYPPTLSGVTLVVQKVARGLAARGHHVLVITASESETPYEAVDDGVRLMRVHACANPFWPEGPIPYLSRNEIDAAIAEFAPQVLHVHDAGLLGQCAVSAGHRHHLPTLATCYFVPSFVTNYVGGGIANHLIESIAWSYSIKLYNRCDQVVFGTEAHRQAFLAQGLKTPNLLISNGIDTTRYHNHGERDLATEERLGLPNGPRLLFVSRLARDKRIDILVEAMSHVRTRFPDAHLLLVGKGPDRERLEAMVAERNLGEAVRFLGFVAEKDLPAVYRACNLFVMASTCEVQSLPTLDALATGLPVVAADAVALPEIVLDGVDGYLVPPLDAPAMANAICHILADPAMARRMGEAGTRIAHEHADERTLELYDLTLSAMAQRTTHQYAEA